MTWTTFPPPRVQRYGPGWFAKIRTVLRPAGASLTITGGVPVVRVNKNVVPSGASLTVTGGVPTVSVTHNLLITPTGASLTIVGSHPALEVTFRPLGAALTITGGTPNVSVSDNKSYAPSGASLAVTGGTPTATATTNKFAFPTGLPLTITGGTPVVTATDHKVITPSPAGLTITGGTPVASQGIQITPASAALTITGGTPSVLLPILATPTGASLTIVGSHPALGTTLRPAGSSLTVAGGTPVIGISDNKTILPTGIPLAITGSAPVVTITLNKLVVPSGAGLTVTGGVPSIALTDNKTLTPTGSPLTITGGTPVVFASNNKVVTPTGASLSITGGTPTVTVAASGPPWTDHFSRANGALGSDWDIWDNTSDIAQISGNIMVPDPTSHLGEGRYLKTVTGSNIGASFTVKGTLSDPSNDSIYLGLGTNNPTDYNGGAMLLVTGGYYLTDGTGTPTAPALLTAVSDGDVIKLEKYSSDSGAHSTITLYQNGTVVANFTDTYSYSGNPETAAVQVSRGASSSFLGIDDFTVYDAPPPPPLPIVVQPTGATLSVTGGIPLVTAINFVGGGSAETTTVTVPAHAIGDVIVIYAFRDGTTGAPTVPLTFTSMSTGNGTSCAHSVGYRIATATNDASGTWTNATGLICMVWRGALAPTNTTLNNGVSATPAYSSVTPTNAGSLVVGTAAHRSVNGNLNVAVAPLSTNRVNLAGSTQDMACFDTNGPVASFAGGTMGATGETSSGWTTSVFALPPK